MFRRIVGSGSQYCHHRVGREIMKRNPSPRGYEERLRSLVERVGELPALGFRGDGQLAFDTPDNFRGFRVSVAAPGRATGYVHDDEHPLDGAAHTVSFQNRKVSAKVGMAIHVDELGIR
jgi:hypothetical protein